MRRIWKKFINLEVLGKIIIENYVYFILWSMEVIIGGLKYEKERKEIPDW
jgi:hypothetical protein